MTVKSNASQVTNMGDQPPELASWSIAIQGWVGKIQIVLGTVSGKWTVQNAYMDPGAPVVEAFPDERLPSSVHECCFVVLRLNREGAGADESYGDEIEDEDNVIQEECEEDGTDEDDDDDVNGTSSAQKQPLLRFSGVGIIMQPAGEKGHFYRTGSLQLKNLGLKALRMLEKSYFSGSSAILDEPESGKGHKIWLD
ncbi:hypothetical protein MPH_06662 [Macrophomina phaseolina MS6]|uniref:Uncharacterized protein n=1 Tax=Macrophomina phaseolina (strain MS6) TaxID=1126212 RepID=K2R1L1_MACPH|nr:hypothetical protein MPH_06662 [Macrophomina phaseolina MS6]